MNWFAADEAGLIRAHIYPMLKLEEAGLALRVDIIRDRGTAERDCFLKDLLYGCMEAKQTCAAKPTGCMRGPDTCAEEAFVCIDVAYTVQERLIEESSFDGQLATAKEVDEIFR